MKISSLPYRYLLPLICMIGIAVFLYARPVKTTLVKVDKDILLTIVTEMAKTMQDKNYSVAAGKKLLASYSSIYKIKVNDIPRDKADRADYLNVFVLDDNKADPLQLLSFRFYLPSPVDQQLTFADLKNHYGDWIVMPIPKVATTIDSMFQFKQTPDVTISVESEKMPDATHNSIKQLNITR